VLWECGKGEAFSIFPQSSCFLDFLNQGGLQA